MQELPKRKVNRLFGYDYSCAGLYFITLCTAHRRNILADIVGAIHESPEVSLKPAGRIVQQIIETLPIRFHVKIDKYVIMPNHIHMILWFTEDAERAIRESPLQRSLLSQVIGYLKMNTSREIRKINNIHQVWQRSYHDHIIRGNKDYANIWGYIDNNPAKWQEDRYYQQ